MRKINEELMMTLAGYMDDDIREKLHADLAPCTNERFLVEYCKIHEEFEEFLHEDLQLLDIESFSNIDGGIAYMVATVDDMESNERDIAKMTCVDDCLLGCLNWASWNLPYEDTNLYRLNLEKYDDGLEDVMIIYKIRFDAEGKIDDGYEALYRVTDLSKVEILEESSENKCSWRTLTEAEIRKECIIE